MNKRTIYENIMKSVSREVKRAINEGMESETYPTYEDWEDFLKGREPIFEFDDGIVYVDYNESTGCLESGSVTNMGFSPDGEASVPVEHGDFHWALDGIYEILLETHA